MAEIIARRQFAPLYIWLDIAFLLVFMVLLLWKKKYMTVLVGFIMGIVYMLVDYGIFHLLLNTRTISEGHMCSAFISPIPADSPSSLSGVRKCPLQSGSRNGTVSE